MPAHPDDIISLLEDAVSESCFTAGVERVAVGPETLEESGDGQ